MAGDKRLELEPAAILSGAVDPQHDHVAGGLASAGVRGDLIECPVAAIAGQFAHAWMAADRESARMVAEVLDRGQLRPSRWS